MNTEIQFDHTLQHDPELEVIVVGSYIPGEPEVRYDSDGSGHPGCAPGFDLVEIFLEDGKTSVMHLVTSEELEEIKALGMELAMEMEEDNAEEE
jgi:hypothetical protein